MAPRRAAPAKVARKAQRGRAGKKAGGAAARRSNKREGETYKARRKLTRRKPDDAAVLEVACGAGVARHLAPVCFVTGCLRGEELSQADVRMLCVHSQSGQACPRIGQVYLHRVCKAVHPDLSISKRSMDVLQSFTADMFERLVAEAARITTKTGQATLTSPRCAAPALKLGSGRPCPRQGCKLWEAPLRYERGLRRLVDGVLMLCRAAAPGADAADVMPMGTLETQTHSRLET